MMKHDASLGPLSLLHAKVAENIVGGVVCYVELVKNNFSCPN